MTTTSRMRRMRRKRPESAVGSACVRLRTLAASKQCREEKFPEQRGAAARLTAGSVDFDPLLRKKGSSQAWAAFCHFAIALHKTKRQSHQQPGYFIPGMTWKVSRA
jgi:hypothetical protein